MADTTLERKTYRRDDGALMVELRPGQFINEELAANLGLIRQNPLIPMQNSGNPTASATEDQTPMIL
jgi:hypothetical protein